MVWWFWCLLLGCLWWSEKGGRGRLGCMGPERGVGLPAHKGRTSPGPKSVVPRVVLRFFGPLDPSWPPFFRCRFFDVFFDRVFIDFDPPNHPKIDPKWTKNRCQNPLRFWHRFSSDFWSMSVRKVRARPPEIIKNRLVLLFRMQTDLFELLLHFDTVLVTTGFHFGTKNCPKSTKKTIKNDIRILIDVLMDFW